MKLEIRKMGFTDRLYFINLVCAWTYTIVCVVLSVLGGHLGIEDYSFVSVVCPLVWGEVAVFSGFIVWKHKSESLANKDIKENITM